MFVLRTKTRTCAFTDAPGGTQPSPRSVVRNLVNQPRKLTLLFTKPSPQADNPGHTTDEHNVKRLL